MTLTDSRRFHIGDRVRVGDQADGAVWTVDRDDTGKTPVRDLEPAYRLVRATSGRIASRYCYESDLALAGPADTGVVRSD